MKPLYEGDVIDFCEVENGLVFCYCEERIEDQAVVAFKMVSFENAKMTNVPKSIYQLAKFGPDYKAFALLTDNYVTCKVIRFPSQQMLIMENNGEIKILDTDASLIYTGNLSYAGEPPSSVALFEDKLWCAYKSKNVLVRYNINSMHEELRIGGGVKSPFNAPGDIFVDKSKACICNQGNNTLLNLDFNTYALSEYKQVSQTPLKYLRIKNYEFLVSENGIYMI